MNTCKDCKWWHRRGGTDCGNPAFNFYFLKGDPEIRNGLCIEDHDQAGNYSIYIGPDFGCIHWEEKDE